MGKVFADEKDKVLGFRGVSIIIYFENLFHLHIYRH